MKYEIVVLGNIHRVHVSRPSVLHKHILHQMINIYIVIKYKTVYMYSIHIKVKISVIAVVIVELCICMNYYIICSGIEVEFKVFKLNDCISHKFSCHTYSSNGLSGSGNGGRTYKSSFLPEF